MIGSSTNQPHDTQSVIDANMFRLRDSEGRVRAVLGVGKVDGGREPGPYLAMFDEDGLELLSVALDGDRPQIVLSDGDDHIEISVKGAARIVFYDQDNNPTLELGPKA